MSYIIFVGNTTRTGKIDNSTDEKLSSIEAVKENAKGADNEEVFMKGSSENDNFACPVTEGNKKVSDWEALLNEDKTVSDSDGMPDAATSKSLKRNAKDMSAHNISTMKPNKKVKVTSSGTNFHMIEVIPNLMAKAANDSMIEQEKTEESSSEPVQKKSKLSSNSAKYQGNLGTTPMSSDYKTISLPDFICKFNKIQVESHNWRKSFVEEDRKILHDYNRKEKINPNLYSDLDNVVCPVSYPAKVQKVILNRKPECSSNFEPSRILLFYEDVERLFSPRHNVTIRIIDFYIAW